MPFWTKVYVIWDAKYCPGPLNGSVTLTDMVITKMIIIAFNIILLI